ncbi:hypothetical protein [Massilia cavernae]|nr:hypothetical protein [Massilia cavernae]
MSIDLDGLVRLALAKVAVRIEKTVGPLNSNTAQEHERRVAELEVEAVLAKLSLQEHCEHDFPGLGLHSNMLTFCRKCGAEVAGGRIEDLRPISSEELDKIMRLSDVDN